MVKSCKDTDNITQGAQNCDSKEFKNYMLLERCTVFFMYEFKMKQATQILLNAEKQYEYICMCMATYQLNIIDTDDQLSIIMWYKQNSWYIGYNGYIHTNTPNIYLTQIIPV